MSVGIAYIKIASMCEYESRRQIWSSVMFCYHKYSNHRIKSFVRHIHKTNLSGKTLYRFIRYPSTLTTTSNWSAFQSWRVGWYRKANFPTIMHILQITRSYQKLLCSDVIKCTNFCSSSECSSVNHWLKHYGQNFEQLFHSNTKRASPRKQYNVFHNVDK